MLENQNEIKKIVSSLTKYFDTQKQWDLANLLKRAYPSTIEIGYDSNMYNNITYFDLMLELEIEDFVAIRPYLESYQEQILEAVHLFTRSAYDHIVSVKIIPICKEYLSWNDLNGIATKQDVLNLIERLKATMIAVSTGGPKIQTVDSEYKAQYALLDGYLKKLGANNPNPYKSLWDWYGRWSQGDLTTYASRRRFIPDLYQPLVDLISKSSEESMIEEYTPTGWDRVDRTIYEMRQQLNTAINEEQFQAIGMLGRETIITIAQQVYNKEIHAPIDSVDPSETDSKRMLDAFLSYELSGSSNERTRKFAKSAVDMANHLTHNRTATRRDASMCLTSVTAVASLIKTIHESSSHAIEQ